MLDSNPRDEANVFLGDTKLTQQIQKGQWILTGNFVALTHQSDSKQQGKQDKIGCHFQAQITWSKLNTLYTFLFSRYTYLSLFVSAFYSHLFALNHDQRGHICCYRSIFFLVVVRLFEDNLMSRGRLGSDFARSMWGQANLLVWQALENIRLISCKYTAIKKN